jgi:Flp pilus assembly protein TadG
LTNTPRNSISNVRRNERGQTLVEFALVLPLLAILLFGIIQFGIVYNNYIDLTDAVRAGARKAAVSRQTTDPSGPVGVTKSAVVNSAGDIKIDPASITVTSDWQPGDDVTVQATYPYSINLLGVITVVSGTLTSKTTERVE